ncbi:hypothetical protein P692DRAFT_20532958 [Suillus brevipes Sb2]|nr:hypothetical protein P692DRAFT_20532958 [Suillus brevipes Sb2]
MGRRQLPQCVSRTEGCSSFRHRHQLIVINSRSGGIRWKNLIGVAFSAITGISLLILGVLPCVLFISVCRDYTQTRGVVAILIFLLTLPITGVVAILISLDATNHECHGGCGSSHRMVGTSKSISPNESQAHSTHFWNKMYCCDHCCSSIRYYADGTYFARVGAKRLPSMRGTGAVAEDYRDCSVKCMSMRGWVVRNSNVCIGEFK